MARNNRDTGRREERGALYFRYRYQTASPGLAALKRPSPWRGPPGYGHRAAVSQSVSQSWPRWRGGRPAAQREQQPTVTCPLADAPAHLPTCPQPAARPAWPRPRSLGPPAAPSSTPCFCSSAPANPIKLLKHNTKCSYKSTTAKALQKETRPSRLTFIRSGKHSKFGRNRLVPV